MFISKYHHQGANALLNKPQYGNHRSLSKDLEQEVLDEFSELAEKGQMLIVTDFHKALEQKTGHAVALTTAYNILKRHKWRKIMPRSRHPKKASDSEIESYKKIIEKQNALSKCHHKVRIMFQDEAGFGRINKPKRCWCVKGIRPCVHTIGYVNTYMLMERFPLMTENCFP